MAAPSAPPLEALLTSALGWLLWSLLVGGLANRMPGSWLSAGQPLARWESPAFYERRLAIRRWKPWLPDAGDALPGGLRKASLAHRDPAQLKRLLQETRRAELVHGALWPFWTVTSLWLPPAGVLINLGFACAFNLPCLLVQRYNRLRLGRTLGRWRP